MGRSGAQSSAGRSSWRHGGSDAAPSPGMVLMGPTWHPGNRMQCPHPELSSCSPGVNPISSHAVMAVSGAVGTGGAAACPHSCLHALQ